MSKKCLKTFLKNVDPCLMIKVCCSSWCIGLQGWVHESKSIKLQSSKTLLWSSGHCIECLIGPEVSSLCHRRVPSGSGSRCDWVGIQGWLDDSSGKLWHNISDGISIPNSAIVSAHSVKARSHSWRHGGTGMRYGNVPKIMTNKYFLKFLNFWLRCKMKK